MMAQVKYLGPKAPRTFPLPLPLLARSEQTGELRFEAVGAVHEVEVEQAKAMCEQFPTLFELVPDRSEKPEKPDRKSSIKGGE